MSKFIRQQAFDVFLPAYAGESFAMPRDERLLDTVFYHEHPKLTIEDSGRN